MRNAITGRLCLAGLLFSFSLSAFADDYFGHLVIEYREDTVRAFFLVGGVFTGGLLAGAGTVRSAFGQARQARQGIVVNAHLAIHGQQFTLSGNHKWVNLGQRSIIADKGIVQSADQFTKVAPQLRRQIHGVGDVVCLVAAHA